MNKTSKHLFTISSKDTLVIVSISTCTNFPFPRWFQCFPFPIISLVENMRWSSPTTVHVTDKENEISRRWRDKRKKNWGNCVRKVRLAVTANPAVLYFKGAVAFRRSESCRVIPWLLQRHKRGGPAIKASDAPNWKKRSIFSLRDSYHPSVQNVSAVRLRTRQLTDVRAIWFRVAFCDCILQTDWMNFVTTSFEIAFFCRYSTMSTESIWNLIKLISIFHRCLLIFHSS